MLLFHRDYQPIINYDKSSSGTLRVRGTVARTGWLQYIDPKTKEMRWEYVSPETLFDPDHTDSIGGCAIAIDHPEEKIIPTNWRKYAVGVAGTTVVNRLDKGIIDVVIVVGDQEAIESIENGTTRQLSMGYDAKLMPRSPQEENRYDQIKRDCNHIAIVELGRAGPEASLHMDAKDYPTNSWIQIGYDEALSSQIFDLKTKEKKWQILNLTI
jgi:hypothetical protein